MLDPQDSLENHVRDTLAAGAGLCDEQAVRTLVTEAPKALRYLIRLGAAFDPSQDGGGPALTREGGHSHNRIVHSGGDRSGAEVQRTLDENALAAGVEVLDRAFALDLLVGTSSDGGRQAAGVRIARIDEAGDVVSVGTVTARAVVLATGGYGQVFASTSNPPAVTGDGLALALRAGLAARDVEFVQFHPTVLWVGPDATGQQALISEAVRGEGAILYDAAGVRVMAGVHPQEDLAPRDVVAAAINRRMAEAPAGVDDHVFLDATHLGERFYERFPSITAACRAAGIDPAVDRIPVAPAAHFACGGVRADLSGRTAMRGLYAVGEAACTGVHGANRLASNSLTEGIVAGTRVGRDLAWELPEVVEADADDAAGGLVDPELRVAVRSTMSRQVGVLRRPDDLRAAAGALAELAATSAADVVPSRAGVRGDQPADGRRGRGRRGDGAHGEPWVPPAHRLRRAARPVAHPPRRPPRRARRAGRDRRPGGGARRVRGGGAMSWAHPISAATRQRLLDAGLDPDAVAALARAAVAEDLDGGIDVTSTATVPADQRGRAVFVARARRHRRRAARSPRR